METKDVLKEAYVALKAAAMRHDSLARVYYRIVTGEEGIVPYDQRHVERLYDVMQEVKECLEEMKNGK